MSDLSTPYAVLQSELRRDGARPLLTFHDDATGERVELSVVTFDNWVSKTANMLQDGLSVSPGDRVAMSLPAHWQTLVWVMASWAVGATLVGPETEGGAAVSVVGPDSLSVTAPGEVVALSLRPLGGRFTTPLPAGVLDYAVEVPAYGDRFSPYGGPVSRDALAWADPVHTQAGLLHMATESADGIGLAPGARLLVARDRLDLDLVVDALLVPLVTGGSAVLVRNAAPDQSARVAAERVTWVGGG